MRGVGALFLLGLVAWATAAGATPASVSPELRQWQTMGGKPPTKAEFAAVVAACEDRAKEPGKSGSIEGCLAEFGLRHAQ
jgi:hypothetical protein